MALPSGAQAKLKLDKIDKRVQYALLAPTALLGLAIAFYPFLAADTLEPVAFDKYPYGESEHYADGTRPWAASLHGGGQFAEGERKTIRAGGRLTSAKRVGVDLEYTAFDKGALGSHDASEYFAGHLLSNVSEVPSQVAEWGLGVARLTGRDDRWGGSMGLRWEAFDTRPYSVHARYQLGILTDARLYHDLSLHFGLVYKALGVSAGYRAFLNPRANSYGPEALLRLWL